MGQNVIRASIINVDDLLALAFCLDLCDFDQFSLVFIGWLSVSFRQQTY